MNIIRKPTTVPAKLTVTALEPGEVFIVVGTDAPLYQRTIWYVGSFNAVALKTGRLHTLDGGTAVTRIKGSFVEE